RAIWIAVGLSLLGFTLVRYKMVLASGGGRRKQDQTVAPEEPEARSGPTPALPQVEARYDLRSQLAALRLQTRTEIRALVRSAPFLVIALFGIGNMVGGAFGIIEMRGTTTLPVTHLMLTIIAGGMSAFMLIVLVFYAGELIHRER